MARLIKIGNSQGIRIPKPILQQAKLEGMELDIQVVEQGILVTPKKKPREGWENTIETMLSSHDQEAVDNEWLEADLVSEDGLEW